MCFIILNVLTALTLNAANTKVFENQILQMELPNTWECKTIETEWICQPADNESKTEAQIILTTKEVNDEDSLENYKTYLEKTKTISHENKDHESEVKYVKVITVNDNEWMDGLHLGSEIPEYYTRYLATTYDDIAILASFSAHQKVYSDYLYVFSQAILSLQVKDELWEEELEEGSLTQASTAIDDRHSFMVWGLADTFIFATLFLLFSSYLGRLKLQYGRNT